MDLRELPNLILDEARGAWRYRWIAIGAAWGVCLLGWAMVSMIPDTYEASARVYVDSRSILKTMLQGMTVNPDVASGLDVVRQAILSRPQIERVAHETGLDENAKTPQQRDALMRSLQERVSITAADMRARTTQGEGLYLIRFQDNDRQKSIEIVDKLLKAFVGSALGDKRTGQETAQRFLDEQISEYERRLSSAEGRLADFKKSKVGLMPDSRGDYFNRMQQESAEVEKVRTNLAVAESRRQEIERQLAGEEPFLFGFDSGGTPAAAANGSGDITFRIQSLEKQLDDLLLRFTEKHPEVIATRATLEELKKRQKEELARVKEGQQASGDLSNSLKTNPVYQSLEIELNRTRVQVAELRQELSRREGSLGDLRKQVNAVPEVEAELARLNRDYEVTRQKYLELVQRRETATLSEQADRTGAVKFDVIEPPSALANPVAPNRPRLLLAVLAVGLALGAGGAWLLNQLRPVFHSTRSLTEVTGVPVLVSVTRTWIDRHRLERRNEVLKFAAVTAMLFVAFGSVYMTQGASSLLRHLVG